MSHQQNVKDFKEKFWLCAFRDHLANLSAYTNCIHTADIHGDGDYRLLIADAKKLLKTFCGTSLERQTRLLGVPSAIDSFMMLSTDSKNLPIVSVAIGPHIFMYQDAAPLFRFTIPSVKLDSEELEIWVNLCDNKIDINDAAEQLDKKIEQGIEVSTRTLEFLLKDDNMQRQAFIDKVKDEPLKEMDTITCMSSLLLNVLDPMALSCLVLGTERRMVYILLNDASDVACKVQLPSAPVFLICSGSFQGNYNIIVSCRDGRIYLIKKHRLSAALIQPDAQPCGIVMCDRELVVATVAKKMTYYTLKGKSRDVVYLAAPPTNLVSITDRATGTVRGLVVALNQGEIHVYVGKQLRHVSHVYGTVTAMQYCRYGREDSALVMVLQNGSLVVELLHRNANLHVAADDKNRPLAKQVAPIPVPHLSSVFTIQTEREKMYGANIYRNFLFDTCNLRLLTAKAYLSMVISGSMSGRAVILPQTSATNDNSLRTAAAAPDVHFFVSVQGLGPVLKLKGVLENTSVKMQTELMVVFLYDDFSYTMRTSVFHVPCLAPGHSFPCDALVQLVEGETKGDNITAVVVRKNAPRALCSVVIDIPEADLIEGL